MLVPLYGFMEGDTLGLLVLAHDDMTVGEVASKLAASAALRASPEGPLTLHYKGRALPPELTVAAAGIEALGRIDVRRSP